MRACYGCRTADRVCPCGGMYRGIMGVCRRCVWARLSPEEAAARRRQYGHAYRARKRAAEVAGPVPAGAYRAVLALEDCVYCGAIATTVDHIVPLARGGWEHTSNLVPSCGSCNSSKCDSLLHEWDRRRVEHAASVSVLVAAAWCASGGRALPPG